MKILSALLVSVFALFLVGCAEQPLVSDEEYNARRGPAPYAPDYAARMPTQTRTTGSNRGY
jgi:hypothetical protein